MKQIIEGAERLGYKSTFYHDISSDSSKKMYSSFFFTELNLNQNQVDYIELCLIQKWMRDKKGMILYIYNDDFGFRCEIDYNENTYYTLPNEDYNIVFEEGIKKALEILEKL